MTKTLELRSKAALEIPERMDGETCYLCGAEIEDEHMKVASLHREKKSLLIRWNVMCESCANDFIGILTMLKHRRKH